MDGLLNTLGAGSGVVKTTSVKELDIGKEYNITRMKKIETKFGRGVVAELEGRTVYLPKRFASLTDGEIEQINAGPQMVLIYNGIGENKMFLLEFQQKNK